jgi:hypothetical protein
VLALLVVPVGHTSQGHDEQHQAFKEAKKKGGLASAIHGLPVRRGLVTGLPVRQAAPARATAEASSVARGLLQFMMILIEKFQALMAAERT